VELLQSANTANRNIEDVCCDDFPYLNVESCEECETLVDDRNTPFYWMVYVLFRVENLG
jgi:hypothetical protein